MLLHFYLVMLYHSATLQKSYRHYQERVHIMENLSTSSSLSSPYKGRLRDSNLSSSNACSTNTSYTADMPLSQLFFERLPIYSSDEAPRPIRAAVIDPATHMPSIMIRITRDENGVPIAKFPPNWRGLGPVVYMWVDAVGKLLIGSSTDFESRFSSYLSAFRGKGTGRGLSLPKAFRKGTEVCVGIAMVCSGTASMKQNETSLIVQKRLAGYALHNVVNGEGDPAILLGSPTADGRGGQIPKKLMPSPVAVDRQSKITDTHTLTPKRYFPVTLNDDGEIKISIPKRWEGVASAIYVFKVEGEDGVQRRLIGETGRPICKRVSEYKGAFNGKGACCNLPLPVAVREAVLDERTVEFSILGVCSPDAKARKKFEAHFTVIKNSMITGDGFNQRLEDSPSCPERSLYEPPSPQVKREWSEYEGCFEGTPQKVHRTNEMTSALSPVPVGVQTRGRLAKGKIAARQLSFDKENNAALPNSLALESLTLDDPLLDF